MSQGYSLLDEASLEGRNTFRVPARASVLADVICAEAIGDLFAYDLFSNGPLLVLGEGSNILFAGDWPGAALAIRAHAITVLHDEGEAARVRVDAGANWNDFVRWSLGHGFVGLENLSLIPGTVGAAPIQNIGAYGVEAGEFIQSVEAFDRQTGSMQRLDRAECGFGYRDSVFRRMPERWIVTAVEFELPRRREFRLDYAGVREELDRIGAEGTPRAAQVAEAICRLRTAKLPDPMVIGNAGSFFKNPVLAAADAHALAQRHPGLPVFASVDAGTRKLSAAWLIEACGWKGRRQGDAGVSDRHALVLVNHGRASGAQILALARRVAADVFARFGVALEPEPRIVGARWETPQ
ncbi:MAG TPA: UDP-N-acetylmuramate dehydrogenase [Xanthomonadaceae bacterium]|nr:UDP-N-acetylmuramate dehydrogenase [Xanthomonadaceae bacterium]